MSSSIHGALPSAIASLARSPTLQGRRCYVVGGFIRDRFLSRETNDIDMAVDDDALGIARRLASETGGTFVSLDEVNRIGRVVMPGNGHSWNLDCSSFSQDIESDLARRDFTIDAMAVELKQLAAVTGPWSQVASILIDPFRGEQDLAHRTLRAVSKRAFEDDPARLLRALRLAAELDLTIEAETEDLLRGHSQLIAQVPGERTREELLRLLRLPGAAGYLRQMDEAGLLLALIPELAEAKGVEQPTVHFWDVFEHSLQSVATLEFLMRENLWEHAKGEMLTTAPWSADIAAHLSQEVSSGSTRRALLKLAALLHDVAKPATKTMDPTGRARFLGHAKQGAAMAASVLQRLRFSNKETGLVEKVVYHHLRPAQLTGGELPTQRAIYRYFRDTEDAGIDIVFFALADYMATRGPLADMDDWRAHCRLMNYILQEHEKQQAKIAPPSLLDGHQVMEAFGLPPGPLVGELLAAVREAQAAAEIGSREEALALVQRELDKRAAKQR